MVSATIATHRAARCFALLLLGVIAAGAQDNVPAPPPMARDTDPAFEVAVIKPADPDDHNQGFSLRGRQIFVESNSMTTILCFAYSIQKTQIVNAPHWFDEELWNIEGLPDTPGRPNWPQYRRMLQKLLAERFGLVLHHEERELPVYAITVAKGGPKLEKTTRDPEALSDQSGHGVGPAQFMKFTNDSLTEFAQFLQLMGDRPVVNQTGVAGRYDFTLLWTPDAMRDSSTDSAPILSTAIQEQLGLKMTATRIPVDVFVIDAATRPTAN